MHFVYVDVVNYFRDWGYCSKESASKRRTLFHSSFHGDLNLDFYHSNWIISENLVCCGWERVIIFNMKIQPD